MKKLIAVFTTIVAALAVVGIAWASGDGGTSTSVTAATETSASVTSDVSTPSTDTTVPGSSTSTSVNSSTSTSVDDSSTSTSIASTTSTSAAGTTSTSINDNNASTTSTTIDDRKRDVVPDGVTSHVIPGVGTVTIEVSAGQLILVDVTAPGWSIERQRVENDRIRLELTNQVKAEAEFEVRIKDGRVEVRIKVDSD